MTRRRLLLFSLASTLSAQVLKMGETSEGFMALFNGRDMGRWEGDEERWTIERGALRGSSDGTKAHVLLLEGSEFQDFDLRFEMRVTRGAASFRMQIAEQLPNGVEMRQSQEGLQLLGNGHFAAALETGNSHEWREYHVRAKAGIFNISRSLPTQQALTKFTFTHTPHRGKFGLVLASGSPAEAEFRNIRLREL